MDIMPINPIFVGACPAGLLTVSTDIETIRGKHGTIRVRLQNFGDADGDIFLSLTTNINLRRNFVYFKDNRKDELTQFMYTKQKKDILFKIPSPSMIAGVDTYKVTFTALGSGIKEPHHSWISEVREPCVQSLTFTIKDRPLPPTPRRARRRRPPYRSPKARRRRSYRR